MHKLNAKTILSMKSIRLVVRLAYCVAVVAFSVILPILSLMHVDAVDPGEADIVVNSIANQTFDADNLPQFNNSTERIQKNGTLEIGTARIPITYEEVGDTPVFEEDIILSREIVDGKAAVDKFINSEPWTNAIIPVAIHPDLQNKERVLGALRYVMTNTPIIFKPLEVNENNEILDPNFVVFRPHPTDCSSNLGMVGGAQVINVANWCRTGSLIHEIGHLVGLWHEQTRCDRDQYLDINEDNIRPNWLRQFNSLCDPNNPNSPLSPISFGEYDYCSIMHYPRYSQLASIDPNVPVMIPKNEIIDCEDIGQRNGYSQGDIDAISDVYPFSSQP